MNTIPNHYKGKIYKSGALPKRFQNLPSVVKIDNSNWIKLASVARSYLVVNLKNVGSENRYGDASVWYLKKLNQNGDYQLCFGHYPNHAVHMAKMNINTCVEHIIK